MPFDLCILASGSSGNCTVLRTDHGAVLIDLGIGPTTTSRRLDGTGLSLDHVRAAVLTHLDSDHFTPHWVRQIVKRGIHIHCHVTRADALRKMARRAAWNARDLSRFDDLVVPFHRTFTPIDHLTFEPMTFSHDRDGSHGFVIRNSAGSIGFATDLGHVPPMLIERFTGVDVLCIESNYDPQMQLNSSRPGYLKQRIMGGSGHLSNEQSLAAVREILDRRASRSHPLPGRIVLLHRSRECNCPRLLRELFGQDPRIASRLVLTEQGRRTDWIPVSPGELSHHQQLSLSF